MRLEHPLRRFRLAGGLLAIVITIGVTGYMTIDGWSLLDSFYMVIITISTVGYTEVHPQGATGRLFTSGLIVVGVGTMLYGFGVFAETLADNAFGRYRRDRQLQRDLNQLRDHFIICGYGRIGTDRPASNAPKAWSPPSTPMSVPSTSCWPRVLSTPTCTSSRARGVQTPSGAWSWPARRGRSRLT
ncbi:MAG: two pore domain potassium channel family protein [Chloroflexi bacterium]|nr:MAG: two pore domain potassium channel family protein [Chloroflexota bacterium]